MGEFTAFKLFLQQKGIQFKYNCPYTHHQNDVVERKYRYIVEIGLTLLAKSHLPFSFWWEAFYTATYLINRMPTPTLGNVSPFQKLYNQIPNYQFLRVFSCSCFLLLKPYNQHKLDFYTQKYIFIVHSALHKGYKCFDKSGKVFITRHLTFNESKFPYTKLFPNQFTYVMSNLVDQTPSQITFFQSSTPVDSNHRGPSTVIFAHVLSPTSSSHSILSSSSSQHFFLTLFFLHIQ